MFWTPGLTPAPHEGREGRDCFEAHQFDRQGNLDFRHAVRYNPERGWEIRRAYRDEPGTRKADRTDKEDETIQYQRLEFDFNGNPILNEYQGEYIANKVTGVPEERPLTDREGIARVVQNFDLLSNKTLEEYYDSERKLKPNKQSIARTIFAYDSIGNPILKIYTNERGRQAKDSFGISKISYAYDYSKNPYGILLEKAQFGKSEEELAEGEDGLSRYEYRYNEECLKTFSKTKEDSKNFHCVEEISFRGKDDQYKGNDKKIALSKFQYDEKGRLTEEKYFRNTEQPMFVKHGITGFKYKYDETCWSFLKEVHPELLVPKCRETDSTCKSKEELVLTCVNETRTFNSGGLLEADYDGIAVYKYRYDGGCIQYMTNKKECINVSETLDIREKPTLYPKERTVVHYDEGCLRSGTGSWACISVGEFYGADGKLKEAGYGGYARNIRQYDEKGYQTLDEYYGADGKLKEKDGYARYVSQYDEVCIAKVGSFLHCKTLEEYYGADGKLKEAGYGGYARNVRQHDEKGNQTLDEYYGADGKLKEKDGYARKVRQYNELCSAKIFLPEFCNTLVEYYGVDGKLKEHTKDGYARNVSKYDEVCIAKNMNPHYCKTLDEFYGVDGKLKESNLGYSRRVIQYNEACVLKGNSPDYCHIFDEYYGADGKLREAGYGGYARNVRLYNEVCMAKGYPPELCLTLDEYYGADGKLKEHSYYGYARYVSQYDEKGNQTFYEYYGTDGKLKEKDGVARHIIQYDEKGHRTLEENYGTEGKLKENRYGYARIVRQYDEKGYQTLEEYYGTDGKLKENSSGYARNIMKYDEVCIAKINFHGACKMLDEYYEADGKLKEIWRGYARNVRQYDEKGNLTLDEYYGAEGKPKEHTYNGYARIVRQYDEKGNRVLDEYYGADRKLKEKDGYARNISQYDEKGNETLEEYYGADGKLKERQYFGYARKVMQYNAPCLSKSKEHIEKNQSCISYQERYDQNEVIIVADKNIFNSSGEFVEQITLTDLIGTKKWNHTENRFRFEEKIESVKEKRTVQKEGKFEEEEVSFPVLKEARYYMEFPNPKGSEGKRKVVVELDRLYRPVGVRFE